MEYSQNEIRAIWGEFKTACNQDHLDKVKSIHASHGDILTPAVLRTSLKQAIATNGLNCIKYIIENIDHGKEQLSEHLLQQACAYGRTDIIEYFIDHCGMSADDHGYNLILHAVASNDYITGDTNEGTNTTLNTVKLLAEKYNVPVNLSDGYILKAIYDGAEDPDILFYCLEQGADPEPLKLDACYQFEYKHCLEVLEQVKAAQKVKSEKMRQEKADQKNRQQQVFQQNLDTLQKSAQARNLAVPRRRPKP